MLIDSHVNLHAPQFGGEVDAIVARAEAAGVRGLLAICDRVANLPQVLAIAEGRANTWCTVGTHPHEAKFDEQLGAETLAELAGGAKVVGIGECGLDYHYDLSPRDAQRRVFATHIRAAQASGLPLVVHSREADADMAAMLRTAHAERPFGFLMHCYTSGEALARTAAELGGFFSVAGIITFKAADDVRAHVAGMPAERILVETDCPYLAPAPMRGRRNEPAFLPYVLARLADIRGWSLEEAEARTEAAFFALFDKAAATRAPTAAAGAA